MRAFLERDQPFCLLGFGQRLDGRGLLVQETHEQRMDDDPDHNQTDAEKSKAARQRTGKQPRFPDNDEQDLRRLCRFHSSQLPW